MKLIKMRCSDSSASKKMNYGLIMTVYLLGIFMGALDTGIVTPARPIIQESLGVSDTAGIWMITIYTLAYAASIPVMGKLADRMGRRTIYLVSIFLFGSGSLLCGLTHSFNSFTALLGARAIQAIGGGGIVPIANAEFGTTFPEEKRGMALGMVGGVYGIANIFGASAGSLVMDIFGTARWEFIFYVNVPIALFILIAGFISLPNTKDKATSKIDGIGTFLLVVMVLCVMYGLKNIDFFDFIPTFTSTKVWPFILAFFALLPIFIFVEKRAEDPVLNLKLFINKRSLITLVISTISGIVLMGVIFVPQMCENAMEIPTGSGGYFVIALGITAGVGAMTSGKLTDKYGPKIVLMIGFIAAIVASSIIVFGLTVKPNIINVFAGLLMIGFAIGFTMGAPLNYMMLWEVEAKEANSALATLSLVRSLGTVVAPAIMVGFIAHAGAAMQDNIMGILPDEINVPELPYAQELTEVMHEQGVDGNMPDLDKMKTIKIDMSGTEDSNFEIPDEIIEEMQSADITTINDSVKHMSEYFFNEMTPEMTEKITGGIDEGINGMNGAVAELNNGIASITDGKNKLQKAINGISKGINGQTKAKNGVKKGKKYTQLGINGCKAAIKNMNNGLDQMKMTYNNMEDGPQKEIFKQQIDELTEKIEETSIKLEGLLVKLDEINDNISTFNKNINKMKIQRKKMNQSVVKMNTAISQMNAGIVEINSNIWKMNQLKEAIPGAFETAKKDYMKQLDAKTDEIKKIYQDTLNVGFRQMFIFTGIAAGIGCLLLLFYRNNRKVA